MSSRRWTVNQVPTQRPRRMIYRNHLFSIYVHVWTCLQWFRSHCKSFSNNYRCFYKINIVDPPWKYGSGCTSQFHQKLSLIFHQTNLTIHYQSNSKISLGYFKSLFISMSSAQWTVNQVPTQKTRRMCNKTLFVHIEREKLFYISLRRRRETLHFPNHFLWETPILRFMSSRR